MNCTLRPQFSAASLVRTHMFQPCVVIPIYNNKDTIGDVLERLRPFAIPCLIVNDGSNRETRETLNRLARHHDWVSIDHLPKNGGKGAAVKRGISLAHERGFSHAVQVDADGQHHLEDVPRFLEAARKNPAALILGRPVFGTDAPLSRRMGRVISQVLVWLETLSLAIADPLFGFRVYPVAAASTLIRGGSLGSRMDFDPEIAVRLCWRRTPIRNLPTRVKYPENGVSHFRMLEDNLLLSWMHARLVLGMCWRAPLWLFRKRDF